MLELKENDIRQFKYSLSDRNLAPRTINRKLSVVRSFFSYFVDNEDYCIQKNPGRNIPRMKEPKKLPITLLSESQAETLLNGTLLTGKYRLGRFTISFVIYPFLFLN
ncbi:MAG TPA: site-specific integrase [Bacillales bacterium]|nr:site-specific integrase [Bacillales bacterium]